VCLRARPGKLSAAGGCHWETRTRSLPALTPDAIDVITTAAAGRTSPYSMVNWHHFHGAATRISAEATMRNFELRVYKLRTKEALDFYTKVIYPRHLKTFPLFGIEAHGFWTAKADVQPRLFVLVSYAADMEPGEVARRYMQSTEFTDDVIDFDVANIVDVESTILIPLTSSPLK
jgi:hypothetical protein